MKPPSQDRATRLTLPQAMAMAEAAFDRGDRAGAAGICRQILAAKPDYFFALNLLGVMEAEAGRTTRAAELFSRAAAANPRDPAAHANAGNALRASGRLDEALAAYDRALAIRPGLADLWNSRGQVLRAQGRPEQALESFDRAIALQPGDRSSHRDRAAILVALGRTADALTAFDRIIALDPADADAHNNRGILLKTCGRRDEALAAYDRAIALRPDLAEAHNNRGVVLQDLQRIDEAITSFEKAVALKPDYSNALWNRSFCRLLSGDFARGWRGFEHRWENRPTAVQKLRLAPDWDGKRFEGSLVVLKEQGIGDEIFHASMLNDLRGMASSISAFIDPRLVELFRRSFTGIDIHPATDLSLSMKFDAQVYLGDLCRYLRADDAAFRKAIHPYLRADADRARELRARIAKDGERVIGLSWVSRNAERGAEKSLALRDLLPLLELAGTRFVNLQYGDTHAEQQALRAATGHELVNVADIDNFNDIDGLAALIEVCDGVVTVSNTTAHLAAALGKPVFVMLSHAPGLLWYWHIDRADSPWYPGVRLFRQGRPGDWRDVVGAARAALERGAPV